MNKDEYEALKAEVNDMELNRDYLLSIAKPILFNTEMVRAISEDRKTETRRCIKPQPTYSSNDGFSWKGTAYGTDLPPTIKGAAYNFLCVAPYEPGDILYVRETWQNVYDTEWDRDKNQEVKIRDIISNFDDISKTCVGLSTEWSTPMMKPRNKYYVYKADGIENTDEKWSLRWRPSIHMPKEAARIFLKVTDVRMERLQEITEEQARSEGVESPFDYADNDDFWELTGRNKLPADVAAFSALWDSTIKKSNIDTGGWEANPWVWVIEFERMEGIL